MVLPGSIKKCVLAKWYLGWRSSMINRSFPTQNTEERPHRHEEWHIPRLDDMQVDHVWGHSQHLVCWTGSWEMKLNEEADIGLKDNADHAKFKWHPVGNQKPWKNFKQMLHRCVCVHMCACVHRCAGVKWSDFYFKDNSCSWLKDELGETGQVQSQRVELGA